MTKTDHREMEKAFVSLRFKGLSLDPDATTSLLGMAPTLSYKSGQPYAVGRRNVPQHRRFGLWLLSSEHHVQGARVADHAQFIRKALAGSAAWRGNARVRLIRDYAVQNELEILISYFWHGRAGSAVPKPDTTLDEIAEFLGGSVEFDFECDDESRIVAAQ